MAGLLRDVALRVGEAAAEFVDVLLAAGGEVARVDERRAVQKAAEFFARHDEVIAEGALNAEVEFCDALFDADVLGGDDLSGGGGSGGAEVGDEICDGEIGFVADGGNRWDGAGGDGAGESFIVEAVQVFERAAAARENDEIDRQSF